MASVSWTQSTSGSWTTPSAWSTGADPLTGDDVTINTANAITVTYTTATLILDSLITGAVDTLNVTGGTLVANNGFALGGALDIGGGLLELKQFGTSSYIGNNVTMTAGALQFTDNGLLDDGVLNQFAGTITINHGILTDEDFGSLGGTVNGNGEIYFNDSSLAGSTVLESGFSIASTTSFDIGQADLFMQESLSYAGEFTLGQTGTLNLNGNALTLSGLAAIYGDVRGGALNLTGTGHLNSMLLDNGALATITGTYNETGAITLGSGSGTGTLSVGSLTSPFTIGTLRITGNNNILEGSGGGTLDITAGSLLEKTAGSSLSGNAVISAIVMNNGTIDAAVGEIIFEGPTGGATSIIGGTLMGAGTVAFDSGSYLLQGESLQGARLLFGDTVNVTLASTGTGGSTLTYGGSWDQTAGLILVENTLDLNGAVALDGGEMKGTATIAVDSTIVHLGQGEDLEGNLTFILGSAGITQTVDQTGGINLGALSDSVDQVTIQAQTTWNLEGSTSISGAFGTITNTGIFEKSSGAGNSVVASDLINASGGTLLVNSGTLSLSGQGTLGGTVGGTGVLEISGAFDIAGGTLLTVGELILDANPQSTVVQATLLGNLTYGNDFAMEGGTLALSGNTLTLAAGSPLIALTSFGAGSILGSGKVVVNSHATIGADGVFSLAQGADLQFNAATQQFSDIVLTGGATAPILAIGATSTYTMGGSAANGGLQIGGTSESVVGTVSVLGTLNASGSNVIAASVVDSGKINIGSGDMQFLGPVSGSGAITIGSGGVLEFDSSNPTSIGVTFGAGAGELYLQSPADYAGKIAGFASGDAVEFGGFAFIGATLTLNGTGLQATISEVNGTALTVNFSTAQTYSNLSLGIGSHGGLSLNHI
jgi:hypothetical protein